MKNDEIVSASDATELSRFMRQARLSFVHALLEECWLLQRRIEHEKLAAAVGQVEFAWFDALSVCNQSAPDNSAVLLMELTSALADLSNLDHILHQVAALVGEDKIACGRML